MENPNEMDDFGGIPNWSCWNCFFGCGHGGGMAVWLVRNGGDQTQIPD